MFSWSQFCHIFFYGDVLKWPAIVGLCFIVAGVMLVNLFGVSRL